MPEGPETSTPTWPPRVRFLRIGEVVIDLALRRVSHGEQTTELPQRVFDVLLLLAAEPHVLHTRQTLLGRVWAGVIVEDANLSQSISVLRKALGEPHKAWIRTRSKQGYVFEPPFDIEALDALEAPGAPAASVPAEDETPAHDAPAPVAASGAAPRRAFSMRATLATAAALALMAALAWWLLPRLAAPADAPALPASVTLIPVEDPGRDSADAASLELLDAWLGWKLGSLPEVTVLTPAHLAADPAAQAHNTVVLLSTGPSPQGPGKRVVRARFEKDGEVHRLQQEGDAADVALLVDRLSDAVLAALYPDRPPQAWPSLRATPEAAIGFLALERARRAHHWSEAVEAGDALVRDAPDFALAHLHLARAQATLGRLPEARRHLETARELLQPMPAEAEALLQAQQLALSNDHAAAAEAYARLAERYPDQTWFAQQQARALGRAGRFADALALMQTPIWDRPLPASTEMQKWFNRAIFQAPLGDLEGAIESARKADALAAAAGEEWAYDRGHTLMLLAQLQVDSEPDRDTRAGFEAAAAQFEKAGDAFSALRARFLGEVLGPPKAQYRYLDEWLAQARAAGQRQLELGALRAAAFQQYRAGNIQAYRLRLMQAMAVAESMDDPWSTNAIERDLLNEEYLQGRFTQAGERIARMAGNDQQGELVTWARLFEVFIDQMQGRNARALAAAERGRTRMDDPGLPSPSQSVRDRYACASGQIQTTMGDPQAARASYARCPATDPALELVAIIGLAEVDLDTGDTVAALAGLHRALGKLPDLDTAPGRWILKLEIAPLLAAAGERAEAERLNRDVLPEVQRAGYGMLTAMAQVGLAELALSRGELDESRRWAGQARASLPEPIWLVDQRIDLVEAGLARLAGDPAGADARLRTLEHEAGSRDDMLARLRALDALQGTTASGRVATTRMALVARTGLRGVSVDWMMPPAGGDSLKGDDTP